MNPAPRLFDLPHEGHVLHQRDVGIASQLFEIGPPDKNRLIAVGNSCQAGTERSRCRDDPVNQTIGANAKGESASGKAGLRHRFVDQLQGIHRQPRIRMEKNQDIPFSSGSPGIHLSGPSPRRRKTMDVRVGDRLDRIFFCASIDNDEFAASFSL